MKPQVIEAATETENGEIVKLENQFEVLRKAVDQYLKESRNIIVTGEELFLNYYLIQDPKYYVVDIRGRTQFSEAYIPGSVNIPFNESWQEDMIELLPQDKEIILICYTGHTSSQTAAFWNMLGLNVKVLANGVGAWNKDVDEEGANCLACISLNYPVVQEITEAKETYGVPVINEEVDSLEGLLYKRVEKYFNQGFSPVINPEVYYQEVKDGLAQDYFLLDIRDFEHYKIGNIAGSVNIPFSRLTELDNLKKLPPNRKIIVVGYTGHDASQIVRVLTMLGYDAMALKDGMCIWNQKVNPKEYITIDCDNLKKYPVKQLNFKPKTDSGPATCS